VDAHANNVTSLQRGSTTVNDAFPLGTLS
jgi:hypothetical protein